MYSIHIRSVDATAKSVSIRSGPSDTGSGYTNTGLRAHSNKLSFDGGNDKMTSKEAAQVLFEKFAYDDSGNPRAARDTEALLLAVWALMEQARYEA